MEESIDSLTVISSQKFVHLISNVIQDFYESEGVKLSEPEIDPIDPYLAGRAKREEIKTYSTPESYDKRKQLLENDRKILRFYAIWDDRLEMFADDTMEVSEIHKPNDGRDPFPLLIRRSKIPKTFEVVPKNFPSAYMEYSEKELREYYMPVDLRIGATIILLGRKFLLYDCDNMTRAWYYQNFGITDFTPIDIEDPPKKPLQQELALYNGYGTIEDSLSGMRSFIQKRDHKDYAKLIDYANKKLRYEARMESPREDDKLRRFIITYKLSNDTVIIHEIPQKNSGFAGGTYLKPSRIAKPGSSPEEPIYYGPQDFGIGARITVFGVRFRITDMDDYVLKFMEENSDQFSAELIEENKRCLEAKREKMRIIRDTPRRCITELV